MHPRPAPALERAIAFVQEGQGDRAVALLEEALSRALAEGEDSFAVLKARGDLASILAFLGEDARAVALLDEPTRRAREDPEEERYRLTLLVNLAESCERAGALVDAEDAARRSVQSRKSTYGAEHPGYGFGLEPLAHVLLRRGKLEDAREAALEAVANFEHHQHPRRTSALALLAEIEAALGHAPLLFVERLDDKALTEVAERINERTPEADPEHARVLLLAVADVLEARLGPGTPALLEALTQLANLESAGGDLGVKERALARLLEGRLSRGDREGALEAQVGLALCALERGDRAEAIGRLAAAREKAVRLSARARALVEEAAGYLTRAPGKPTSGSALAAEATQALEERVLALAPEGLVARLRVSLEEGEDGLKVDLQLSREPSAREKAAVEAAVETARREVFAWLAGRR